MDARKKYIVNAFNVVVALLYCEECSNNTQNLRFFEIVFKRSLVNLFYPNVHLA